MVSFIIQMLDKSNLLVVTGLQSAATWDPDEGSEDFLKIHAKLEYLSEFWAFLQLEHRSQATLQGGRTQVRGIADIPDNVATSAKMWDNAMGPRMSNISFQTQTNMRVCWSEQRLPR